MAKRRTIKNKRMKRRATAARRPAPRVRRRAARASAPAPARRRKMNPKGLVDQPAVRFAGLAVAGAALGTAANKNETIVSATSSLTFDGKLQPATIAGAAVVGGAWLGTKGKTRSSLLALGVGMLVPQVLAYIATMGQSSSAEAYTATKRRARSIAAPAWSAGAPSKAHASFKSNVLQ